VSSPNAGGGSRSRTASIAVQGDPILEPIDPPAFAKFSVYALRNPHHVSIKPSNGAASRELGNPACAAARNFKLRHSTGR
jgi:hypothetical protein